MRRLTIRLWSLAALFSVMTCATGLAASPATGTRYERTAIIQLDHPPQVPTALDSVPHPWPGAALLMSAVGVALPIVVADRANRTHSGGAPFMAMLAAEVVTPSAGHLYAGLTHRAAIGMAVRGVAFGIAAAGGASAGMWSNSGPADYTPAILVVLLGASIEGVMAVADVVTVASDVQRRNDDWLSAHAVLGMRMLPDGSGPALALTVKF